MAAQMQKTPAGRPGLRAINLASGCITCLQHRIDRLKRFPNVLPIALDGSGFGKALFRGGPL